MAQSIVLDLQSGDLVFHSRQSAAQIGVLLALRLDLLLLLLNRLDDGCEQFAIRNAVGVIVVVLPFDQREAVLGFGSLDRVVQRNRQGLFEVLRDKAIALGFVAIIETKGHRLKFFDEIEAETGIEHSDVLLAPTVGNAADARDLGMYF